MKSFVPSTSSVLQSFAGRLHLRATIAIAARASAIFHRMSCVTNLNTSLTATLRARYNRISYQLLLFLLVAFFFFFLHLLAKICFPGSLLCVSAFLTSSSFFSSSSLSSVLLFLLPRFSFKPQVSHSNHFCSPYPFRLTTKVHRFGCNFTDLSSFIYNNKKQ